MSTNAYFDEFQRIFMENIRLRSRTANGKTYTNVSLLKLPLLKRGLALDCQMRSNLCATVMSVWESAQSRIFPNASLLDGLITTWFDLLQNGLIDFEGYRRKKKEMGLEDAVLDVRYRIWEVNYDLASPHPSEIDGRMKRFFNNLSQRLSSLIKSPDKQSLAEILAFSDRQLDRVIHPWLDGCGRLATSVVMWIAARTPNMPLPKFGERSKHYKAIETRRSHEAYFLECLSR